MAETKSFARKKKGKRESRESKMYREIVISVALLVFIFTANFFARNFTEKSIDEVTEKLEVLQTEMITDGQKAKQEYEELEKLWLEKYEILAYYIEHDELEKVSSELYQLKGSIQTDQIDEGIPTIENCKFMLSHIRDKDKFEIKNIF